MPRRDRLARNLQRLKGSPALLKKTRVPARGWS
jgi:hypothetical protein